MLARLVAATSLVALSSLPAAADTPFSDRCEGNVCFQRKVQTGCMIDDARRLMSAIAQRFGKIEIASACDGRHARRSAHYVGKAFDFRPYGASTADVVAFLKESPLVGGVGTYSNGLIHADVADRKMAWHGRGRGRIVWPIGAGTIVKSPDDPPAAPTVLAGAFSFPFNLLGGRANPAPTPDRSPAPALPDSAPVAAAAKLPPLPPRRPTDLRDPVAAPVQLASAGEPIDRMPPPGEAVSSVPAVAPVPPQPPLRPSAMFEPVVSPSVPTAVAFAPIPEAPAARAERIEIVTAQTDRGFGAEESPFSAKPLAPRTLSFAAGRPSLISASLAPY